MAVFEFACGAYGENYAYTRNFFSDGGKSLQNILLGFGGGGIVCYSRGSKTTGQRSFIIFVIFFSVVLGGGWDDSPSMWRERKRRNELVCE